ncbi:recombinase family protein [Streptomyces sp. NPDC088746]|uniref:recombinase family protein n=1 Tax=Streptomyces sp. NPDC088746 TaxID=3365885 RepID=UPI0037FEC5CD
MSSRSSVGSRNLISARTIEALAAKRAAGVRLGRPRICPDLVLSQVVTFRLHGWKLIDIATELNRLGTPTPGGGSCWYPSHVSRLLRTQDALRMLNEVGNQGRG